ncbi:MAG: DNA polymerase Y family protein [Caulobacteraceae bacterium]
MARILSVWSPNWPITCWRRRNPSASPDEPFALVRLERGQRVLHGVNEAARGAGLYPGQKATDAAALAPELRLEDADEAAEATALTALVDWCVRYAPAVAADDPDGLFLDISGVAHLFGGEAALMADLTHRLARSGIPAAAAIADTPGAAWALARFGPPGSIAPPQSQGRILAALPVMALRLEPATQAQLMRLGLSTIAALGRLPRGQITRRFGPHTVLRLDQALGAVKEALTYRRPPNPWFTRLAFAEPVSAPEDLARISFDIAALMAARLEAEGQGARRFSLGFHRLDGRCERLTIGLSLPGRDPKAIARLFAPLLEKVDPGFGIEVATLTAERVLPMAERQARIDARSEIAPEDGVAPLVDRLVNRLGEGRVWRARPYPSHAPERAVVRTAPLEPAASALAWDPNRPRPLRLFAHPEPIEAMAPVPDDPPVTFRWRGRTHRVRRAEGPERLAEEWWRQRDFEDVSTGALRDYYRVEDDTGARFWVFRSGLYDGGAAPKWWLHGLFP